MWLGAKAQCQSVTMLMCSVMEWPVEEVLCIFSEIKSRWRASVRVCWRGGGGGAGGVTDESFLLKTFRPHPHEIDVLVKQVGLYVLSA